MTKTQLYYREKLPKEYSQHLTTLTTINGIHRLNSNPKVVYIEGIVNVDNGEILDTFDEFKDALNLHTEYLTERGITTLVALVEPEYLYAFEKLNFKPKYNLLTANKAVMVKEVV